MSYAVCILTVGRLLFLASSTTKLNLIIKFAFLFSRRIIIIVKIVIRYSLVCRVATTREGTCPVGQCQGPVRHLREKLTVAFCEIVVVVAVSFVTT